LRRDPGLQAPSYQVDDFTDLAILWKIDAVEYSSQNEPSILIADSGGADSHILDFYFYVVAPDSWQSRSDDNDGSV